jgi:hypothetical protein
VEAVVVVDSWGLAHKPRWEVLEDSRCLEGSRRCWVDIHKVPVVVAGNKAVEVVHNLHKVACHCCSKTWKEACGINKYCVEALSTAIPRTIEVRASSGR